MPPDWNEDTLLTALENIDQFLEVQILQLSPHPACCGGTTQTALLNIDVCTSYIQLLSPNDFHYVSTSGGVGLVIDSHAYDLTPLNSLADEGGVVY